MTEDTTTPTIAPEAVYPHNPLPLDRETADPDEVVADAEARLRDQANIDDVMAAIEALQENGITDERRLTEFGKRMSSLIYHGGLTPSAAKAQAAEELFRAGRSKQDLADLLGMTRGGFNKLSQNAGGDQSAAGKLHFMTMFNVPLNLVFDETIAAEPPADFEKRYVLLEVVNPQLDDEEVHTYTRGGPDTQLAPKEPQYALVEVIYTPGRGDWSADNPAERTFGMFSEMEVSWYMDEAELVADLYEDQYFDSEDRAETWKVLLEEYGFTVESNPRERLNPDVLLDDR